MIQYPWHQAAPSGAGIDDERYGYWLRYRPLQESEELLGLEGEKNLGRGEPTDPGQPSDIDP
jgi:hypothetical protein